MGDADSRATEIALAASLGEAVEDRDALIRVSSSVTPEALEASVRGTDQGIVGGRMMIEDAPRAAFDDVGRVVGVAWSPLARALADASSREQARLILGWDVGGSARIAKAYLNVSDGSAAIRSRIAAALSVPIAAHVIGVNVRSDGAVERKGYVQHADTEQALAQYGPIATRVALASVRAGVAAGAVISYDLDGREAHVRAVFIALRDGDREATEPVLELLPGYSREAMLVRMPFDIGAPRSLGLSLASAAWTVYAKLPARGRTLYTLDPLAMYRAGDCEVGVFIEPRAPDGRSYANTKRFAVSYRVFGGVPSRLDLHGLMAWAVDVVSREEQGGEPRLDAAPPSPWAEVKRSIAAPPT